MSTKLVPLTQRQKEIIRILAKFTQETPATAADIAQELAVSTRTVLREIPTIEKWLTENQVQFIRKPGVGLVLVGQLERLVPLLEQREERQDYSKEERRHRLLFELLKAQQPTKAQSLTRALRISEGTLGGDLDYAKEWLSNYDVTLCRRPGLGIYLEAQEPSLRQAMVGVLLEDIQESVVLELLEGDGALFHPQTMSQVADTLTQVAKDNHFHYTDRGYLDLSLYLSITVQRIAQGHHAQWEVSPQDRVEYPVAAAIVEALNLPSEEIYWIARQLVGAIQRGEDQETTDHLETIPLRQLVLQMVDQVEEELGKSFGERGLLVGDLMRHMEPALCRLQMGIPVKNPHVDEMKTQYPDIYTATQRASQRLCGPGRCGVIPESEVAFITMHFCAAVERMSTTQRNISAVLVCPTGVGMSRILAANLAKYFKGIEVKGVVSAMRISPDWLSEQGIDLVISTVKLALDYPNICVHPGLRPQDKILITEQYQRLSLLPQKRVGTSAQNFQLRSTIHYVEALGEEILRLVGRVTLHTLERVESKDALIEAAASLFTQGEFAQSVIKKDLEARDAISETYIEEGKMLLLHCRTSAITCCQLGYIRLNTPYHSGDQIVTGAIVMLVHQSPSPAHVEMMGQVSTAFLEDQGLYLAAQQGSEKEFAHAVEQVLGRYYRKILQQLSEI